MWSFNSPEIVFGEDALDRLADIEGQRAFIVTDATIVALGFVDRVTSRLESAGLETAVFDAVVPDPGLDLVRRATAAMTAFEPDWVVGLGGGSSIDTAKAAWFLYERPDLEPDAINPFENFGLRQKARLIAIATTSGTGAETTWATVLTEPGSNRKLGLAAPELLPDLAIVDPQFAAGMPPAITVDTGFDALTHAVEAYSSGWANDFSDGLALQAIRLIFRYLPRAHADGDDREAREKLHNAAAMAGLAFSNGSLALAHSLGHAIGAVFGTPHGRAVGLFLPYTIEYVAAGADTRYADIAHTLHLPADDEATAAASVAGALRRLGASLGLPATLAAAGIEREALEEAMPRLVEAATTDTQIITSLRIPDEAELERLFRYAFDGRKIDF